MSGAVLNEGMGRLLALLDVLENYPGRNAAPAPAFDDTPDAARQAMDAIGASAARQLAPAGE
ncbi:hypothetical protein D3C86_1864830 [compost metagenome]